MSFDPLQIKAGLQHSARVARVVVAGTRGSVPREVGASMVVWPGGQIGTIGGGRLEWDATAEALEALQRGGAVHRTYPLGPALGQCCGGAVTVVTEVFDTVPEVGRTYARPIGNAQRTPAVDRAIERAIRLQVVDDWVVEPVHRPNHALWLYGAGHVGRSIVDILGPLPDWEITWVDVSAERFPDGAEPGRHGPDPAAFVPEADVRAHHLILTHSHELDLALCHSVLSHDFAFAGLIGSATKWARFRSRLAALGHDPARINRITCPIGDPSLGKHPQAIAIGVAAQLIELARQSERNRTRTVVTNSGT